MASTVNNLKSFWGYKDLFHLPMSKESAALINNSQTRPARGEVARRGLPSTLSHHSCFSEMLSSHKTLFQLVACKPPRHTPHVFTDLGTTDRTPGGDPRLLGRGADPSRHRRARHWARRPRAPASIGGSDAGTAAGPRAAPAGLTQTALAHLSGEAVIGCLLLALIRNHSI